MTEYSDFKDMVTFVAGDIKNFQVEVEAAAIKN